jgi:hypothetical protein
MPSFVRRNQQRLTDFLPVSALAVAGLILSVSVFLVLRGYYLSADRQQFASYEGSLVGELQEYLTEHARREAYALLTPPRVKFAVDDDLAVGEFGIATRVAQPDEGVPALPVPPVPAAKG